MVKHEKIVLDTIGVAVKASINLRVVEMIQIGFVTLAPDKSSAHFHYELILNMVFGRSKFTMLNHNHDVMSSVQVHLIQYHRVPPEITKQI